jgi:HEAT repeat protein
MANAQADDPFVSSATALRQRRIGGHTETATGRPQPVAVARRDIRRLIETYDTTPGDPAARARAASLMIASIPPALRDALAGDLRTFAARLPTHILRDLTTSASPHVRSGARLLIELAVPERHDEPPQPPRRTTSPERVAPVRSPDEQALASGLEHPDAHVRLRVIDTLRGTVATNGIVERLIAIATTDPWPDVRAAAAEVLVTCDAPVRIRFAEAALTSDAVTQVTALSSLDTDDGRQLAIVVRYATSASDAARSRAIAMLGGASRVFAMASLWHCLPHQSVKHQDEILAQLRAVDEPALATLVRASLTDADTTWRTIALAAVDGVSPDMSAHVIHAVNDPDPDVRLAALRALRARWIPDAFDAVADRVRDPRPDIRAAAVGVLSASRDGRCFAPLLAACGDPVEDVRVIARDRLRSMASPGVIDRLVQELGSRALGATAEDVLIELGDIALPTLIARLEQLDEGSMQRAGTILRAGRPGSFIRMALRDGDAARRRCGVIALAASRARGAVTSLLESIDDPDPSVRILITNVLTELGDPAVVDELALLQLRERDPDVVEAIGAARARLQAVAVHATAVIAEEGSS